MTQIPRFLSEIAVWEEGRGKREELKFNSIRFDLAPSDQIRGGPKGKPINLDKIVCRITQMGFRFPVSIYIKTKTGAKMGAVK